ncbi:hypothetical protein PRUPE_3G057400 [Prunus persica]|uniref:Uncharacterized protein n=1 Tax=Prunus persica TaxID=3760 RepID=A0A251PVW1_PRUPE|nr:uncharacterized protein LOC109947780 isoform X1 [Prunus persica]ONI15717.1 hypothetical protein PRUPE_3G057400 [Prunus persica]
MEGSDKVLLSSTPTRRSVTQEPSASDENDQYYQQVGNSHLRSPKKPMAKNYMSPTISATSKAIVSRMNILGERNEASEPKFSNTLVEKSPHIGTDNGNDSLSQALPLTPSVFQSHDDGKALSDSLSSRPYDPITNYLSPRPQFLRYNPNRRRERFLGLEYGGTERNEDLGISRSGSFDSQKAIDEEAGAITTPSSFTSPRQDGLLSRSGSFNSQKATDEEAGAVTTPSSFASPRQDDLLSISCSFDSQKAIDEEAGAVTTPGSLASPRQDGLAKQGDEEVEVNDGEIEESDEEIEESNEEIEESDEEYEEVKEEKKGWKLKGLLKSLLLLLVLVLFTSHISTMNHQTVFEGIQDDGCIQNHTLEAALLKKLEIRGMLWDGKEERHMGLVEIGVEEGKLVEFESGSEVMGQGEEETQMDSLEEVLELKDEEIEVMEVTEQEENGVIDELGEKQVEDIDETFDRMAENSDQIPGEVDHLNPNDLEEEGEVAVEQIDGMVENKMEGGLEEYFTNMIAEPAMSETMDNDNLVSDVSNDLEEEGEVAVKQIDGMVENKMEGGLEEYFTNMIAEHAMSETMDNDDDAGFDEILKLEAEGNWREELITHMKLKTFYTARVGVSIFSVIVASLVLAFCFKQRNGTKKGSSVIENPCAKRLIIEQKKINEKVSSLPLKPYSELVIAEKYKPVLPNKAEDSSIEHVYSSFRRMSLSSKHSTEAASEENYHSQAPAVELLGEFVVGEVSSSLRTCSMKNKITESEESNYSVSSKKKLGSKVQSVSFQVHPTASEFSSMDCPSYGSYITPQKIMKKKEGGKDEEVTTPLRRSSRIRNRTVMSP